MAVIHAIANGAWSTPTIWDGGVVPTAEDDVYLDNHIISGTAIAKCVYITGTGHLTGNRLTADAVITTHYLFGARGAILNGNVIFNGNGYFTYESASGQDRAYTINGNVTIEASQSVPPFGGAYYGGPVVFNGNIINNSSQGIVKYANSDVQENIFNGNITCNNGSLSAQPYGGGGAKILLNGNCWFIGRMFSSNNITPYVYIGGEFSYDSNTLPFFASTYATSSTARIINRNRLGVGLVNLQYEDAPLPQEDAVKAGVHYGIQGEYVGQYTPDYPPESVVLKDYEYGDSDDRKTGTLENEVNVEVDNTNTINVYPYKRRNNG